MNFKLLHIGLHKGKFEYKIIIENGKQKILVLIISPKNNIRFQWKNFIRNYPLMAKEKIWQHNEGYGLWHGKVTSIEWIIVLKFL